MGVEVVSGGWKNTERVRIFSGKAHCQVGLNSLGGRKNIRIFGSAVYVFLINFPLFSLIFVYQIRNSNTYILLTLASFCFSFVAYLF